MDAAARSVYFAHMLVCQLLSEGTPPEEAFNPTVGRGAGEGRAGQGRAPVVWEAAGACKAGALGPHSASTYPPPHTMPHPTPPPPAPPAPGQALQLEPAHRLWAVGGGRPRAGAAAGGAARRGAGAAGC